DQMRAELVPRRSGEGCAWSRRPSLSPCGRSDERACLVHAACPDVRFGVAERRDHPKFGRFNVWARLATVIEVGAAPVHCNCRVTATCSSKQKCRGVSSVTTAVQRDTVVTTTQQLVRRLSRELIH